MRAASGWIQFDPVGRSEGLDSHPTPRHEASKGMPNGAPPIQLDSYYASRPRGSQIGAWASPQSEVLPDRHWIEQRVTELEQTFGDVDAIPRPAHWGGWLVRPTVFEFWQGRPSRLHDRLRYRLDGTSWVTERLAP